MQSLHETDAALLEKFVSSASETAFTALVKRHSALVHGVCARILENRADVQDACQATFIALALKARRLDARHGLGGWLHSVARLTALSLRRSSEQSRLRTRALASEPSQAGNEHIPSPILRKLDEAIEALPWKLRETIIAHYLEGASVEELARRFKCSPSAITMRLTRGREKLRLGLGRRGLSVLAGPVLAAAASAVAEGAQETQETKDVLNARDMLAGQIAKGAIAAVKAVAAGRETALLPLAKAVLQKVLLLRLRWTAAAASLAVMAFQLHSIATPADSRPAPADASSPAQNSAPAAPSRDETGGASSKVETDLPLIEALRENRYSWEQAPAFKRLLEREAGHVNTPDSAGRTPLHWAAIRGHNDYALLLILSGAEVNAADAEGYTPLHYAAKRGDWLFQRLLILRRANLSLVAADGMTPLTLAIRAGSAKDVATYLWMGAQTILPGVPAELQPETLLRKAGSPELLEALDEYERAQATNSRYIPTFVKNSLHEAARVGDLEKLEAFLFRGANIDMQDDGGNTALHKAVQAAQDDVLFYLLACGANPNIANKKGVTPLMNTMVWVGSNFDGMRRFLIARDASPFGVRKDGLNELTHAADRGNTHGVQWLLWLGANGREKTRRGTPYQIAFQAGRQQVMDLFKRNGIEEAVQLSDDPAWNLHNAVKRGDHALLEKFLADGVSVNAPDREGNSPLITAILAANVDTARLLIGHKADIDYVNPKTGMTAIYMTVIWDYQGMTDLRKDLLESGVNPNIGLTSSGETPLMRAVWHHPTTGLKQLIEHGADLNLRNKAGLTALGIALRDGKHKTADYLRGLGAVE